MRIIFVLLLSFTVTLAAQNKLKTTANENGSVSTTVKESSENLKVDYVGILYGDRALYRVDYRN